MSGEYWVLIALLIFCVVMLGIVTVAELIRDRREGDDE